MNPSVTEIEILPAIIVVNLTDVFVEIMSPNGRDGDKMKIAPKASLPFLPPEDETKADRVYRGSIKLPEGLCVRVRLLETEDGDAESGAFVQTEFVSVRLNQTKSVPAAFTSSSGELLAAVCVRWELNPLTGQYTIIFEELRCDEAVLIDNQSTLWHMRLACQKCRASVARNSTAIWIPPDTCDPSEIRYI